ncbi:MAG: thioredoxin family protein [Flavipsychrobacter sp.]
MKRVLLVALAFMSFTPMMMAGDKNKKAAPKVAKEKAVNDKEIEWLSWDDVQVKMKKEPRKVWVDVYTDWCGWCKRMDATTFKNPELIKYMNTKFYAVRFNAEKMDSIRFMGKLYVIEPQTRTNQLAVDLMRGQMSYPTGIFMEEEFVNPQPIPGYHPVPEMEMILKFLGENVYKKEKFEDYQKTFKATWGS